jgi:hypothetical protein
VISTQLRAFLFDFLWEKSNLSEGHSSTIEDQMQFGELEPGDIFVPKVRSETPHLYIKIKELDKRDESRGTGDTMNSVDLAGAEPRKFEDDVEVHRLSRQEWKTLVVHLISTTF